MKSLQTGSSRIDDKHIATVTTGEAAVAHHPQNMGMAAHENIWTIAFDELERVEVIVPRIASDMSHQYVQAFPLKMLVQRIIIHQPTLVAIAHNADKRLERSYPGGRFVATSEITGMPYLVAVPEELGETVIEDTVCVGYYTYIHIAVEYTCTAATTAAVSVRRRDSPR